MEDALFNFQWLAATQGVKVVNDKLVVKRTEVAEVEEGGKVTSVNSKLAGELVVIDTYGKTLKVSSLLVLQLSLTCLHKLVKRNYRYRRRSSR